jgi:uncharacterized protein YbcI
MDAAADISVAITAIHRTAYGRELSTVETVVGQSCVACVLRFEVSAAERAVIQAGDGAAVVRLYDATELSLEAPLRAAVERTTGRSVLAFQSTMSPEHSLIMETFVLVPHDRD